MLSESHKKKLQAGRREAGARARREIMAEIIANKGDCTCGLRINTTNETLRAMYGCKDPYYVCPTLDKARRRLGVV